MLHIEKKIVYGFLVEIKQIFETMCSCNEICTLFTLCYVFFLLDAIC